MRKLTNDMQPHSAHKPILRVHILLYNALVYDSIPSHLKLRTTALLTFCKSPTPQLAVLDGAKTDAGYHFGNMLWIHTS
jgi:hypothetical protein